MKRLAIIGAGDLGRQLCHMAVTEGYYQIAGYYDDFLPVGINIDGYHVLGYIDSAIKDFRDNKFDCLLLGIGYKNLEKRKQVFEYLNEFVPFGTLVHSKSYVDPTVMISEGVVVYPGCIIDQNVITGKNVLINIGCTISHNTKIEKHTYISPSVSLAGYVYTGECCFLGIGTTVIDHISLTNSVQTGGGTVVTKNIEKPGLYVGNPNRFIK